MLSFEQAGIVLDAAAEELPEEIFTGLNGGVNLLPRVKTDRDGFYVLGQYIVDATGRRVEIYFGSFEESFAGESDELVSSELKKTLLHELTHHLEDRAGDRTLEKEDVAYKTAALARLEAQDEDEDIHPPRAYCEIENADEMHLPEMARLERLCFSDPWPEKLLEDSFTDGEHKLCLVALEDGDVRGYILVQYVMDEAEIMNIAVDPDERRRGIGTALIGEAMRACRRLGVRLVHLEVRQSNEAARGLYEHYGFAEAGRRRNYYRFPKEDAIIMTKRLDT